MGFYGEYFSTPVKPSVPNLCVQSNHITIFQLPGNAGLLPSDLVHRPNGDEEQSPILASRFCLFVTGIATSVVCLSPVSRQGALRSTRHCPSPVRA